MYYDYLYRPQPQTWMFNTSGSSKNDTTQTETQNEDQN